MSAGKTHINRNRTILILLGILLATILTLNARSLYSAEIIPAPTKKTLPVEGPQELNGKLNVAGLNFITSLAEKFSSLK